MERKQWRPRKLKRKGKSQFDDSIKTTPGPGKNEVETKKAEEKGFESQSGDSTKTTPGPGENAIETKKVEEKV